MAFFRLSKHRGQHLLSDPCIVEKIIAAAGLSGDDFVLEVGPGMGALTGEIAAKAGKLIAVELDPLFVRELKKEFEAQPHIEIVEGDILQMNVGRPGPLSIVHGSYKLLTNLPYNITSAFLNKFLTESPLPERIVIMIQKEVADRILVSSTIRYPLNPKSSGFLGLMCNLYAECSSVCKVPASSFVPPPKVDSAVIMLKPYKDTEFADKWGFGRDEAEKFLSFAHRFFGQPRKKMTSLLPKAEGETLRTALASIGESPDSRPAVLSLEKWVELWKEMS